MGTGLQNSDDDGMILNIKSNLSLPCALLPENGMCLNLSFLWECSCPFSLPALPASEVLKHVYPLRAECVGSMSVLMPAPAPTASAVALFPVHTQSFYSLKLKLAEVFITQCAMN